MTLHGLLPDKYDVAHRRNKNKKGRARHEVVFAAHTTTEKKKIHWKLVWIEGGRFWDSRNGGKGRGGGGGGGVGPCMHVFVRPLWFVRPSRLLCEAGV